MKDSPFFREVALLVKVLPLVAKQEKFALKGGTAINLFIRDMPRLSVDIDLTYLPIESREESLKNITESLLFIKKDIEERFLKLKINKVVLRNSNYISGLIIRDEQVQVKIEVNLIIRGGVYELQEISLCKKASDLLSADVSISCLSLADIFGGKICAALDRQHPRDLFDIMILLQEEGLTDQIRKAFIVYLLSHDRPINELLNPTLKNIEKSYNVDFQGMTEEVVSMDDLLNSREKLINLVQEELTLDERNFIFSFKRDEPDWSLAPFSNMETLPTIQWKLMNIRKMSKMKREKDVLRLEKVLFDT